MNHDTKALLLECGAGVQMALGAIDDVLGQTRDKSPPGMAVALPESLRHSMAVLDDLALGRALNANDTVDCTGAG